jgi:hypothetical protein
MEISYAFIVAANWTMRTGASVLPRNQPVVPFKPDQWEVLAELYDLLDKFKDFYTKCTSVPGGGIGPIPIIPF